MHRGHLIVCSVRADALAAALGAYLLQPSPAFAQLAVWEAQRVQRAVEKAGRS